MTGKYFSLFWDRRTITEPETDNKSERFQLVDPAEYNTCENDTQAFCACARTATHKAEITFPWGVISVWLENSWCGKLSNRLRERGRENEKEKGRKEREEWKRSLLAVNSFGCPSGSAEPRRVAQISGWQCRNCLCLSFIQLESPLNVM